MAIVCIDGFETGTVNPYVVTNGDGVNTVTGRDPAGIALSSNSTNIFTTGRWVFRRFTSASDTIYGHMSIAVTNYAAPVTGHQGSTFFIVLTDNSSVLQINAQFDAAGHILLFRGESETADGGVFITQSTLTVPTVSLTWFSLEYKVRIHDTLGECILKIDGVEFINYVGDTRFGGSSTRPDAVGIRSKSGQNRFDDFVVFDTTDTVNNSWPGALVVVGLRPAGNGAYSDLMGSDGNQVNNYQQVDEYPPSMTDYNGLNTVGARDTYDLAALTKVGNVLAVQSYAYAQKSDSAVKTFKHIMRSAGGSVVASAPDPLFTSALLKQGPIWITDADGTSWTVAKVNAHEFGFEVG